MEEKTKNVEELRREFFTSKKEFVEKANDCVALAKSYLNTLLEGCEGKRFEVSYEGEKEPLYIWFDDIAVDTARIRMDFDAVYLDENDQLMIELSQEGENVIATKLSFLSYDEIIKIADYVETCHWNKNKEVASHEG